jgi:aldose 1-epimerase
MGTLPGLGPEGAILRAEAGGYAVTAHARGAALARLVGPSGRELVVPTPDDGPRIADAGAVLAPWPNRLEDGVYRFQDAEHRVPVDEPERGNALHGLVRNLPWHVEDSDGSVIKLITELPGREPYPFRLRLTARFAPAETGLDWTLTAENLGDRDAPYAAALHPYLVGADWRADRRPASDDWTVVFPAGLRLAVDERLLPTGTVPVTGTDSDLRAPTRLGPRAFDFAGTGFPTGPRRAAVLDASGHGAAILFSTDWAQIYTDDADGRRGVAIEPQTAPANALRGHPDLVVLAPGARHTLRCRILEV